MENLINLVNYEAVYNFHRGESNKIERQQIALAIWFDLQTKRGKIRPQLRQKDKLLISFFAEELIAFSEYTKCLYDKYKMPLDYCNRKFKQETMFLTAVWKKHSFAAIKAVGQFTEQDYDFFAGVETNDEAVKRAFDLVEKVLGTAYLDEIKETETMKRYLEYFHSATDYMSILHYITGVKNAEWFWQEYYKPLMVFKAFIKEYEIKHGKPPTDEITAAYLKEVYQYDDLTCIRKINKFRYVMRVKTDY